MSEAIQLSIVIACRNEARHIEEFVASILAQDFGPYSWEAIIADGMSADGTRSLLERLAAANSHIRVIDNPGRIVSTGLNAAIRLARGEYILRMDAHTVYAPDYCAACVRTLEQTGADNVGGAARTRSQGRIAGSIAAAYQSRFSTGGAPFHNEEYEGWADTVPYGCWRRRTLLSLGLFDESLVRNQDDELNLRLLRRGGRIWQSRSIVSWYYPRSSFAKLFWQYSQYGYWKVAVIRKHRLPGSVRHLVPATFVLMQLLLPLSLAALLAAAAGWSGAGLLARSFLLLWLGLWSAYTLLLLAASVAAARRQGWDLLPLLPMAFATYHVAYGSGFLTGLLQGSRTGASATGRFAEITR